MDVKNLVFSAVFGALGAFAYSALARAPVAAQAERRGPIVNARGINLIDSQGRLRAQIGFAKGGDAPGIWLMDEKGVARAIMGLYEDDSGYFGIQDATGAMSELMRTFGPKHSPLLIFKKDGEDAMIQGLNPTATQEPFLFSYERDRRRKMIFGAYEGP